MEKEKAIKKESHSEKVISLMKKYGDTFSQKEKKDILLSVINNVLDDHCDDIGSPEDSLIPEEEDEMLEVLKDGLLARACDEDHLVTARGYSLIDAVVYKWPVDKGHHLLRYILCDGEKPGAQACDRKDCSFYRPEILIPDTHAPEISRMVFSSISTISFIRARSLDSTNILIRGSVPEGRMSIRPFPLSSP